MPAARTLEQLTAQYADFRALGSIRNWTDYRKCSGLLRRLDQDIFRQRNQEKKRGLQCVKDELKASRAEAKGRLSPETTFGLALASAEEGTTAVAIAYGESVKRLKTAATVVKTEQRLQAGLMAQQAGHNQDAVAAGYAMRAGEEDRVLDLPGSPTDDPEAPSDDPEAPANAPAPKAKAKGKAKAKAKAKVASAPAAASAPALPTQAASAASAPAASAASAPAAPAAPPAASALAACRDCERSDRWSVAPMRSGGNRIGFPHCGNCGYTPLVAGRLPNARFLHWSDEDMLAFLDGDACNYVAWTAGEAGVRRLALVERFDSASIVRIIQLRQPGFRNNRQKKESLVRKMVAVSPTDAHTLWRIGMVEQAASARDRGSPDHVYASSEPLTGDPAVDRDLGKRIREEVWKEAQEERLAERVHSPRNFSGAMRSVTSSMSSGDSWRSDMRLPGVDKPHKGDAGEESDASEVKDGDAGATGDAGAMGDAGATGDAGAMGDAGEESDAGAKGGEEAPRDAGAKGDEEESSSSMESDFVPKISEGAAASGSTASGAVVAEDAMDEGDTDEDGEGASIVASDAMLNAMAGW